MVDDPRNPALEEALLDDPTDREAYSVLADWLESLGDPRAALIRLQTAKRDKHDKAVRKLFHDHGRYLLGPLTSFNGLLTWAHGFVCGAKIGTHAQLAALLDHPSGRFLRALSYYQTDAAAIAMLAERAPRSLRELQLYAGNGRLELASLTDRIARLVDLVLNGAFVVAGLALPVVEGLRIDHPPTDLDPLDGLELAMPRLRRLELGLSEATPTLFRWLARADLALTELTMRVPLDHRLATALCEMPTARSLTILNLQGAEVVSGSDALVDAVRQRADGPFPALAQLWLDIDADEAVVDELDAVGVALIADRYDDVGE